MSIITVIGDRERCLQAGMVRTFPNLDEALLMFVFLLISG